MDHFLQEELQGDMFWYDDVVGPVNPSAFAPYISRPPTNQMGAENAVLRNSSNTTSTTANMNNRMLQFMRRNWPPVKIDAQESETNRWNRHKMSERMRREREREGYLALHSLLPHGTKNDKKSITLTAAKRIQELKRYKVALEREIGELQGRLLSAAILGSGNVGSTKIKIQVNYPTCGLDSMVEVLKCLKRLGLKATSIESVFSDQELQAVLDIQTDQPIEADEVERAIKRTLQVQDVDGKLAFQFPEDQRS